MGMSDYENQRWAELQAELSRQRRLVALDRRLGSFPSHRLMLCWAAGGGLGLVLLLAGAAASARVVETAGEAVWVVTLIVTGFALIAVGVLDIHRQRAGQRRR